MEFSQASDVDMRQVSKKFRLSCMAWNKNRRAAVKKGEDGQARPVCSLREGGLGGLTQRQAWSQSETRPGLTAVVLRMQTVPQRCPRSQQMNHDPQALTQAHFLKPTPLFRTITFS